MNLNNHAHESASLLTDLKHAALIAVIAGLALLSQGCNHCAYLYDGGKVDGINRPFYLACDVNGKAKVICDDVRKLPTDNCNESNAPK